ncbi:DUF2157 domain-containing protein [Phosphitispora fastidiosa]|uniref:DUF2157 domain-containing protein n=1 Tax=Phosphitispora fastidiosa TaxID=2837202 RepID=UPI001E4D8216|nr:DUF2157 domain-containing protein [Phosphitispora fastidiosa]MBU7006688.1 putative membrane protein [Phosphitispora fastidiosa]
MPKAGRKMPGQWLKWLEGEVALWKNEGIIDDTQARNIMRRYPQTGEETARGSRLITLLSVMGALLLGVGVILFFAANWQVMPKWLKVGIVLGSILLAYGTGYWLAFEKGNYPRVGRALIFLGTVLYGSGIWLIAQIFHINAHYPNGVLFWVLGIIPVVLVCRSLSVLVEASLLLTLWTLLEQTGFQHSNLLYLPVFILVMVVAYKVESQLAVGITLPGLAVWLGIAGILSMRETEAFFFTLFLTAMLGILIYITGNVHGIRDELVHMKLPYQLTGLPVFFISLYLLSFRVLADASDNIFQEGISYPPFFLAALLTIIAGIAAGGIYVHTKSRHNKRIIRENIFLIMAAALLPVIMVFAGMIGEGVFVAAVNILLFACIIAVVVIGYSNREPEWINIGIVFFVLDVIARYFDFFWDMLPKSLFFMAGGALLLIGGTLLERNRRKVIQGMKVNSYEA